MELNIRTIYDVVDTTISQEFVNKHLPLVKRIAVHLKGRLPVSIQVDDLVQAGMIGLLEASQRFDKSKGASFETYAGIRIRGAMLDDIRRCDWAPRSVHRNARKITSTIQELKNKTGRDPKASEVAALLGIELEEYYKMVKDSDATKIIAFEDLGIDENVISEGMIGKLPNPLERLQKEYFKKKLAHEITKLPEKERLVLALYYDEELNLREIGDILNVSESRVSQIHSNATAHLKEHMKDWRNEFH